VKSFFVYHYTDISSKEKKFIPEEKTPALLKTKQVFRVQRKKRRAFKLAVHVEHCFPVLFI
jgi:hypothetical protein